MILRLLPFTLDEKNNATLQYSSSWNWLHIKWLLMFCQPFPSADFFEGQEMILTPSSLPGWHDMPEELIRCLKTLASKSRKDMLCCRPSPGLHQVSEQGCCCLGTFPHSLLHGDQPGQGLLLPARDFGVARSCTSTAVATDTNCRPHMLGAAVGGKEGDRRHRKPALPPKTLKQGKGGKQHRTNSWAEDRWYSTPHATILRLTPDLIRHLNDRQL